MPSNWCGLHASQSEVSLRRRGNEIAEFQFPALILMFKRVNLIFTKKSEKNRSYSYNRLKSSKSEF